MKPREKCHGITLVNTGEGKGKSSSAFGVVFRAAGWGMKVCVIQYIKGNPDYPRASAMLRRRCGMGGVRTAA